MKKGTLYLLVAFACCKLLTSCNAVQKENLALQKNARASSSASIQYSHHREVFSPNLAFDGDPETKWASYNKNVQSLKDGWLKVDLGKKDKIKVIRILWSKNFAKQFAIEVSEDSKTWHEVSRVTQSTEDLIAQNYWACIKLDKPVKSRYVRMKGYEPSSKFGYSLYEFEVY